jgi:outer membrane protein TolC
MTSALATGMPVRRETMRNPKFYPCLLAAVLAITAFTPVLSQGGEAETVRLSLDQCLRAALENNLDLVSARKDPAIAEQRLFEAGASFDGSINVNGQLDGSEFDQDINDIPNIGSFETDNMSGSLGWSQLLGYGATYDVTYSTSDNDTESSSIQNILNEFQVRSENEVRQGLRLNYSMPLLRGFGKEATRIGVLLAKSGVDISNEDFRQQAILTLKSTEDAYWDLVAARAAHDVSLEALKLAQDLYEQNKRKVEVGALAPIDVTQAEAGVAAREEDVIVAEMNVRNAEDNLRRYLAIPSDDPTWFAVLEPTDKASYQERIVDYEEAIAVALERRPEVINARRALRDSELSERVARNGARHSLTLDASFTPADSETDLSTQTIPPPPAVPDLPSTSSSAADGQNWSVGMTYGYTIGNKRAKANYAISRIDREKSEVGLSNVEQDIRVDVRAAARAVTSGAKRVAAARANTGLQRKTVEAEQKKYDNGMSTSFEVLRILNDLSDAQLAEIRAVLDYTKALADLERAKGTLLEARGLALGS